MTPKLQWQRYILWVRIRTRMLTGLWDTYKTHENETKQKTLTDEEHVIT